MDIKLRLLNKLEGTVHKATVAQKDWREQAKRNQGELEAARVSIFNYSISLFCIISYIIKKYIFLIFYRI
jgi:hypothetical protein